MTGSDPFLRTGTSLSVLFEAKQTEALVAALALRRLESSQKNKNAKGVTGTIAGTNYVGLVAPGDFIKSYSATIGKSVVVVTNSLEQLRSIIQVSAGRKPACTLSRNTIISASATCAHPQHEHVFALISDATIRRWCGPSGGSGPPAEPGLHPPSPNCKPATNRGPP